jgi:hypothetical protein
MMLLAPEIEKRRTIEGSAIGAEEEGSGFEGGRGDA